jgi:hypothetical protein
MFFDIARDFRWFIVNGGVRLRQYLGTSSKSCMLVESSTFARIPLKIKIATDGFYISRWATLACTRLHDCNAHKPNNFFMFMFHVEIVLGRLMVLMSPLECQEVTLMHICGESTTPVKMWSRLLIWYKVHICVSLMGIIISWWNDSCWQLEQNWWPLNQWG